MPCAMARIKTILALGDTPEEAVALVQFTCILDFAITLGSEVEKHAVAADLAEGAEEGGRGG